MKEKKLMINTLIIGFGSIFPKLFTFLLLPLLTFSLSKEQYGLYDMILTGTSLFIPFLSLQIEQAVFRFLLTTKNKQERSDVLISSLVFVTIVSLIMTILGVLFFRNYENNVKYSVLFFIILTFIYKYVLQVCRGIQKLKIYSTTTIINSIFSLLLIYLSVSYYKSGIAGIFFSLDISMILSIIFCIVFIYPDFIFSNICLDISILRNLLKYSTPLVPNTISWWIVNVSDRWIISYFLGLEFTGLYAISNKIPNMFNLLYNNFNLAWQESATESLEDGDYNSYYTSIFNKLLDFLFTTIILLITSSPLLFKLLISSSYEKAYYQMSILFIGTFFYSFSTFYGGIYVGLKKTKEVGLSTLVGAIINIGLNLLFIKKIGLYAAAFSTSISYILTTLYRANDLKKYIEIKYNSKRILGHLGVVMLISGIHYQNNTTLNIINLILALTISYKINKKIIIKIIQSKKKKFIK